MALWRPTHLAVMLLVAVAQFDRALAQGLRGGQEALNIRPLVSEPDWSLVSKRSEGVRNLLQKTFPALPKNEQGRLSHSAVRYLLNRYFVKQHGWNVMGLQTEAYWNGSSPVRLLDGHVLPRKMKKLESRLKRNGFSLNQTVELVGLFETVIHNVMVHDLRTIFLLHDFPIAAPVTAEQVDEVLFTYVAAVTYDKNVSTMERPDIKWIRLEAEQYHNWNNLKNLTHSHAEAVLQLSNKSKRFTFSDIANVVPQIMEQLRIEKTSSCQALIDRLTSLEDRNHGCVRLARFYDAYAKGEYALGENAEYLRVNGIVGKEGAEESVITRNYVAFPSNCKRASPMHNMCCESSRCDDIFQQIEQSVASPYASPEQILDLVVPLAAVSNKLKARLIGLAQHKGLLRLHGRLFAQWMHHVFPRDCEYPRFASVPRLRWTEKYMSTIADAETYVRSIEKNRSASSDEKSEETCMHWSDEEEPYVVPQDPHLSKFLVQDYILDPSAYLLLALVAVALWLSGRALMVLRRLTRHCKGSNLSLPLDMSADKVQ